MNSLHDLQDLSKEDLLNDDEIKLLDNMFNEAGLEHWMFDEETKTVKLKIKLINKSKNPNPKYNYIGDSGFDFMADLPENESIIIESLKRAIIPTGIHVQIPIGFEIQVRPRSGLAFKHGITVLNSPGTIDAGYLGEIKIILYNTDESNFIVNNGDRIAQGVIMPVQTKNTTMFIQVDNIEDTDRGSGGFGSTGV